MESIADLQKLAFLRDMKKKGESNRVCNVGLWRYRRHPNYFAEWMVWTALVVASIPSWLALSSVEPQPGIYGRGEGSPASSPSTSAAA